LHLCSNAPDDRRFYTSAFNIGDIGAMTEAALIDTRAGKNVYIEPRLVRPGRPDERGGLGATLAVFAIVGDHDVDTGKTFAGTVPASMTIETSPPDNTHSWFFLRHAIGATEAQALGKMMREHDGGDSCSGNCVQPFRCAGTTNFPNRKKTARGRIANATWIQSVSGISYSADELRRRFITVAPIDPETDLFTPKVAMAPHSRGYSRVLARGILAADPNGDRSAAFMAAVNHAINGGMTASEFEMLARRYPDGCAMKYLEGADRLRAEIARAYSKDRGPPVG
jgi:hypothetical protein